MQDVRTTHSEAMHMRTNDSILELPQIPSLVRKEVNMGANAGNE